ncbi:hypothetical protein BJI47_02680 [Rhodococcus sp. 1168]|nr:hypothetical protein BJI47_02680 [Rhodococcus sp. 1168]
MILRIGGDTFLAELGARDGRPGVSLIPSLTVSRPGTHVSRVPTAFLALDHGECKVDRHCMVDLLARLPQRSLRAHPPSVDGGQKLMLATLPRPPASTLFLFSTTDAR